MSKLAGKNQKWGRCHVPGHSKCSVVNEIRHPLARTTDKINHFKLEGVGLSLCPQCDQMARDVTTRRLNTKYVKDELNFYRSCRQCYVERVAFYQDMWNDTYG